MASVLGPVVTPAAAFVGSRLPTTPVELVSPSTRRIAAIMGPSMSSTASSSLMALKPDNDDEKERKARRRSRILEIQRRNFNSPATPTDKRRSMPLTGLSNAQLSDHYTNCIKLSAENKINSKNAFGLHLIDYLSEILKKKDMNNFQVASSTLDASAKIYAGRVDAIHTETYKVLTGLGRGGERDEGGGGDAADLEDEAESEDPVKNKRKRAHKDQTIETNLDNINVDTLDLEYEVDPLFQKTSATFDEGGSGGLLLNQLYCINDSSAIVLDSKTMVTSTRDTPVERSQVVDLTEIKGLHRVNLDQMQICPEFSNFLFTDWNPDEVPAHNSMSNEVKENQRIFDIEAEVEPLFLTMPHPDNDGIDDNGDDLPADDFTGNEDDPTELKGNTSGSSNYTVGDGKEARLVESVMSDMKHGTIGSLMQVLSAEPTEYSYFSTNILRSWAGPEHWKVKAKTKDKEESAEDKPKRKKKEPLKIDFEANTDVPEKSFKETRASTTLTKATLNKYSKSRTTLPEDLHYDPDNLFRLFNKPKVMVRRQETRSKDVEDGIDNYDYNNENDKENFVPDVEADDDDDDVDPMGGTMAFNFSEGEGLSQSQDVPCSQGDGLNTTVFTGENLVSQPDKIAKMAIGYAKTAKKIDVKRLKASIWNLLLKPEHKKDTGEEVAENEVEKMAVEDNSNTTDSVNGQHTFTNIMTELPNSLSKNMTKNLSVPIAFVCLLHLANEKTLKISSNESMEELYISQG